MSTCVEGTTIHILGKSYQIKCKEEDVLSLQRTAEFLEKRMADIRRNMKLLSSDRVIVMAALQIAYEFLQLESKLCSDQQSLAERMKQLLQTLDEVPT